MSDQLYILKQQQSDDDEEDLERLRLEALKSIHMKNDQISSQSPVIPSVTSLTSTVNYHHMPENPLVPSQTHYKTNHPINTFSSQKFNLINNENATLYPNAPLNHNLLPKVGRSDTIMHLNNYENRQRFENIDLNEPYVPQHVSPINTNVMGSNNAGINGFSTLPVMAESWNVESVNTIGNRAPYVPYVPHKISENIVRVGNVQLSPRSMAFVAENNDILLKRKSEKNTYEVNYSRSSCISPGYSTPKIYRSRSPSPIFHRCSPSSRRSPCFKSKSRSPIPRIRHKRRSNSPGPRSPVPRRKTPISPLRNVRRSSSSSDNRYLSKSPLTFKYDKSPTVYQRNKISPSRMSRSPTSLVHHGRETLKTSPNRSLRKRSPDDLHRYNKHRGNSPSRLKKVPINRSCDSGEQTKPLIRRSKSPITNQSESNNYANRKSYLFRVRSRSRTPSKRYQPKRSRDRNTQIGRRRSPYDRNSRKYILNGNRNRNRKSVSPINKRRRSKTRSPYRLRRIDNRYKKFDRKDKRDEKGRHMENKYNKNNKPRSTKDDRDNTEGKDERLVPKERKNISKNQGNVAEKKEDNENISPISNKKTDNIRDDKELKITTQKDDKNLSNNRDINNYNDIEMKDEDDSDSNNDDGIDLFASDESESENEGRFKSNSKKSERNTQVSTLSFSKLGESIVADIVKNLQDVTRPNNDQDYDKRHDNNKKKKDDRRNVCNSNNSDRRRNNINVSNSNNNINNCNRDKKDSENSLRDQEDKRSNERRPMFKSTFTVVETETKTNEKILLDKEGSDNKGIILLKKTLQNKFDKDSPDIEKLSSTGRNISSNSDAKKSIHLRLGAMTNTFKTPKKTSNWTTTTSSSSSSSIAEKV